ncbi:MAG: hypothetical protein WDM71_05265 [Ferruginibacter sp.]
MNIKYAFSLFLILFIGYANGQSTQQKDSSTLSNNGCDQIFTLAETMADFKDGPDNFDSTLFTYITSKGAEIEESEISFLLTISKASNIVNVQKIDGYFDYEKDLIKWLRKSGSLWSPAIQNGHLVCSFRRLDLKFSETGVIATLSNAGYSTHFQ